MSRIEYGNFKTGCITCKGTPKRPEKNVTNDFRVNFCYEFVHAKLTLSMECQKCCIKEDFNQNDSLSIS